MNSKEKMNPNTEKILTALKLPEDQLKLVKDYITGSVGEEVLDKFNYKDLSSLSAYDVEHAMYKLIVAYYKYKDKSAYDDVCRLINILFAIGQGTCYHMIEDELFELGVCEDFFTTESEEMLYKYYVIYANKAFKPDDFSLDFYDSRPYLYNFGRTDIELAGIRKAIDCLTVVDKGKIYLMTIYFRKKYTDKFVDSLVDARKNLEESSENLAELGRMLVLNSTNSPIRIEEEDHPLLEMYENMMINSLGSILDKKFPVSELKDIQKAVRSDDMNKIPSLIRKYGCEELETQKKQEMRDIGSWAYQNISLSSVFKNIVTLCFSVNSEVMFEAACQTHRFDLTRSNYADTSIVRIGGDFDKLLDIDTRIYIKWMSTADFDGNVLARQFQTNKDIYLEVIEEEIAHPGKSSSHTDSAVNMLEVVKKNDPDLYQSIIGDITKKYRVRYMEDTASRLIKSYERYASKTDGVKILSDDEQDKIKDYLLGRETLDAIYPIAVGMPSKNYRVRYTYTENFIKLFGDCEFTRRCAIVAMFVGACDYLAREVRSDHGEDFVSEQKLKKLFAGFEEEGLSIEYQLKARDLIKVRYPFDPVGEEKYNDKFKYIFARYLKEKREETVAAFYSASPSGQNFGLAIMEENPEEYKQEILHLVKFGSSFIRDRLLEILYRQKNWEDDIIALLSSEKRDIHALGEAVLMRWQNEGADYAGRKEDGFSGKGYLVDCEDSTQTNKLVAASADADAFQYRERGDGTIKISLLINKSIETVVIPQQIDGKTVTGIEPNAFYGCSSLTTVMIPASMKIISEGAFCKCSNLANVTIPNSVTEIGVGAFCQCSSLANVTIPSSVTEIENYTFVGCSSLTSITIPDSMTKIGNEAFAGCGSLTTVTIPDSVMEIGLRAFYGCSSLRTVTIPASVKVISEGAFYGCSSLTNVTIPGSVTEIENYAFSDCESLTTITTPAGSYAEEWAKQEGYSVQTMLLSF